MNFISHCHSCWGWGLEMSVWEPKPWRWCPEQGSWPSVLPFFLAPGTQRVQTAGRKGWPFVFCSCLLGWRGAGSCSAPSIPTHQCLLSPPALRRGERFSCNENFSRVYFTSADAATNINPETGQKAFPECALLKQRQRPAGNPCLLFA